MAQCLGSGEGYTPVGRVAWQPQVAGCWISAPTALVFSCVRLLATLWTVAHQALLSIGFSRQEYWSGLPYPPPGDLPNPGIESASPMSPVSQADSLSAEPLRKPHRLQSQEQIQVSTLWMCQLSVAMAALKESRWGRGTEDIKDTKYLGRGQRSSFFDGYRQPQRFQKSKHLSRHMGEDDMVHTWPSDWSTPAPNHRYILSGPWSPSASLSRSFWE